MVSKLVFSNLLLASVALAAPSSLEVPTSSASTEVYNQDYAGALLTQDAGTFYTVTGTFTVPTLSGSDGGASAFVGIDNETCQAFLWTGVDFWLSNGEPSYNAWYQWYPDDKVILNDFSVSVNDVIYATVTAHSTTSGTVALENQSTGVTLQQDLSSSATLCETNAEWFVQDPYENGTQVHLVDFGAVTFSSATASGFTPSEATTFDIQQNGQALTSSLVHEDSVVIQYI